MGLKVGCAAIAAQKKLFVLLNTAAGHPYLLAQVRMRPSGDFYLLYPDGSMGVLQRCQNCQLELVGVIPNIDPDWKQSEEQKLALVEQLPKERIIFDGKYPVGSLLGSYFPPPAVHVNDEERFRKPHGPWETTVARYLKNGPTLVGT